MTFDEILKRLGKRENVTVKDVGERFGCGTRCGACVPYLELALKTGRTSFDVNEVKK